MTLERTWRLRSTTATAVSSQDDSIARRTPGLCTDTRIVRRVGGRQAEPALRPVGMVSTRMVAGCGSAGASPGIAQVFELIATCGGRRAEPALRLSHPQAAWS